nr:MAG TPA: Protein of unknown function (DUF2786) [Caudoviricetes sp.]
MFSNLRSYLRVVISRIAKLLSLLSSCNDNEYKVDDSRIQ